MTDRVIETLIRAANVTVTAVNPRVIETLARLSATATGVTNHTLGPRAAKDKLFGGISTLSGITTINSVPAQCRVLLMDKLSSLVVRSTFSNSSTGFYEFRELSTLFQFYVIAVDPNNVGNNNVSNFVIPGPTILATATVLWHSGDKSVNITLSNSNLTATATNTTEKTIRATLGRSTGQYYFEVRIDVEGAGSNMVGIAQSAASVNDFLADGGKVLAAPGGINRVIETLMRSTTPDPRTGFGYKSTDGKFWSAGVSTGNPFTGVTYTTGDVIGVAYNATLGNVWFAKNNTYLASGNPVTGVNPAFSGLSLSRAWFPAYSPFQNSNAATGRFKTGDFTYSPPTGFSAWNL